MMSTNTGKISASLPKERTIKKKPSQLTYETASLFYLLVFGFRRRWANVRWAIFL